MVYAQLNLQTERVKCVAFHPKRPWVIFSCQNGFVELWDYVTKALIDKFRAHNSPVRCIDFHSTQPLFVTGGDDATIKLWSLSDRKLLYVFTGHTDYIRSVFSTRIFIPIFFLHQMTTRHEFGTGRAARELLIWLGTVI